MKTLQNNFTTPEQSKRLLELGLPADSADMYYSTYKREGSEHEYLCNDGTPSVINIHRGLSVGNFRTQSNLIPCWSVGRLIEIWLHICDEGFEVYRSCDLVDILINAFEEYDTDLYAEFGKHIDFSKLED